MLRLTVSTNFRIDLSRKVVSIIDQLGELITPKAVVTRLLIARVCNKKLNFSSIILTFQKNFFQTSAPVVKSLILRLLHGHKFSMIRSQRTNNPLKIFLAYLVSTRTCTFVFFWYVPGGVHPTICF